MKKLLTVLFVITIMCQTMLSTQAQNISTNKNVQIRGVDISSYLSLINSGVEFYDFNGIKQNENSFFKLLSDNSINYIRIRIWNNPYDSNGNSYGGGVCDLNNAIKLGKMASKYNIKLFIDFHLSDFWADPTNQQAPKEWQDFDLSHKQEAVYNFVYDSLKSLRKNDCNIGMVQIGNEINSGICGETNQENIAYILKSGFSAVHDINSTILRVVHYTNPEQKNYEWFASNLKKYNVDYDVFATSYYSYWHGTIENLTQQLNQISKDYNKFVLVAETAYPFTTKDSDFFANNISGYENTLKYPVNIEGQSEALRDVFGAMSDIGEMGLGVFYWEPAWITVGTNSYSSNYKLWEKYGSGWESSFASEYCKDGAIYHGGSSWDNQALFNELGQPTSSLRVFNEYNKNSYSIGDINLDGKISIADATLLQRFIVGIITLSNEQLNLCDVTLNGLINVQDVTRIQKNIVKINSLD